MFTFMYFDKSQWLAENDQMLLKIDIFCYVVFFQLPLKVLREPSLATETTTFQREVT